MVGIQKLSMLCSVPILIGFKYADDDDDDDDDDGHDHDHDIVLHVTMKSFFASEFQISRFPQYQSTIHTI